MGKEREEKGKEERRGRGVESGGKGEQREREREERPLKEGTHRDESTFSLSLATTSERREVQTFSALLEELALSSILLLPHGGTSQELHSLPFNPTL